MRNLESAGEGVVRLSERRNRRRRGWLKLWAAACGLLFLLALAGLAAAVAAKANADRARMTTRE